MAWKTTASSTTAAVAVMAQAAAWTSQPTILLQLPPPPIPPKHHRPSLTIPSPTDSPPSSTTEESEKGSGRESERGKWTDKREPRTFWMLAHSRLVCLLHIWSVCCNKGKICFVYFFSTLLAHLFTTKNRAPFSRGALVLPLKALSLHTDIKRGEKEPRRQALSQQACLPCKTS